MPCRISQAISLQDRQCLLQALRVEGYDRVMREKDQVLNKYFAKPKTGKEVDKILRYFAQKSRKYNHYGLARSLCDQDYKESLSSKTLFKWHHVLPQQEPVIADAIADAVPRNRLFDWRVFGFWSSNPLVLILAFARE